MHILISINGEIHTYRHDAIGENMQLLSFLGGIHPPHSKEATERLAIEDLPSPSFVKIPLRQHIGAPCEVRVAKGDNVFVGQLIGEAGGFVSAGVHSSVSGIVTDVKKEETAYGMDTVVYIENDHKYSVLDGIKAYPHYSTISSEEIISIIKNAGIVGMGGAGFPTHVKLTIPENKKVDTVILNGAECEPFLTCDHRLMLEDAQSIIEGLLIIQKAVKADRIVIGIENNKKDAIEHLKEVAKGTSVEILALATKYPQGAEKQLIYAVTKREIPSGGLPADVGVVVNNVATAAQISKTFRTGLPLVDRVCTVTGGAINNPKNVRFRIGTPLDVIIDFCGGYKTAQQNNADSGEIPTEVGKVILGGPMMGVSQYKDTIPAMKNTSGILCLTKKEAEIPKATLCIKCGKCLTVCPIRLQPIEISTYSLSHQYEKCKELNALDCIECGSCSFICPAKRPLLQSIRVAKREILSMRRKHV